MESRRAIDSGLLEKAERSARLVLSTKKRDARLNAGRCAIDSDASRKKPNILRQTGR